jgi:two-component system sensor histidine kinase HydH
VAGIYGVAAVGYIVLSSRVASSLSRSLPELTNIEIIKGIAFVLASSGILFLVCYRLLSRLQRREQIIAEGAAAAAQAERTALAGVFASALAHDINNALSVGLAATEDLRHATEPGAERTLRRLTTSMESIQALTSNLLDLRPGSTREPVGSFDLAEVLRSTVEFARHHQALRRCEIGLDLAQREIPFAGRSQLVRRAVLNMILNAAEAADGRATIEVSSRIIAPDRVVLRIDDDGPGIPPERRDDVLRPFYTTKTSGTGIGMLSVIACAHEHDGTVRISDSPLGGARISLELRQLDEPR